MKVFFFKNRATVVIFHKVFELTNLVFMNCSMQPGEYAKKVVSGKISFPEVMLNTESENANRWT